MENMLKCRGSIIVFLALLTVLGGCGPARDYARLSMNYQVEQEFQRGQLLPGYRYYFNGPTGEPTALLALKREYQLSSDLWHEFKVNAQLTSWMKTFAENFGKVDDIEYVTINYRGFEIRGEGGERIGMLYTKYYWVVAWWVDGNRLIVTQPEPSGGQRGIWSLPKKWSID